MKTLKDVLAVKGSAVLSIRPSDSAFEAMRIMSEHGVGALLVMDGGQIAGMLSERDVARRITLDEMPAKLTHASEIMTVRITCGRPDLTIAEGMAVMTDKRVRHLPVLDGDRVIGVVSIGDLVKAVIDDQQFTISQLEHYIAS